MSEYPSEIVDRIASGNFYSDFDRDKAAVGVLRQSLKSHAEAEARIVELEAALATAKAAGLEEAAKVADDHVAVWDSGKGIVASAMRCAGREIATAIRAIAAGGA